MIDVKNFPLGFITESFGEKQAKPSLTELSGVLGLEPRSGGDFVDNILRWGLFTGVTPISMVQADQFEIRTTRRSSQGRCTENHEFPPRTG